MHRALLGLGLLGLFAAACGSPTPPAVAPPTETTPPPATSSTSPPPATTPAEPTAEDKAKAEAKERLAADRAAMEKNHAAELARWTPEMKAEAKALAGKAFPSGQAAVEAAAKAKFRSAKHAARDAARHPAKTMAFFGLKPNMQVLEVGPGEGWYTELLAPTLAHKGQLFVTMTDPNGPKDARVTFYGELAKLLLASSPELYGKVTPIVVDLKAPALGLEGKLDMALLIRGMHGLNNAGHLGEWLGEIHKALKPGGVLGVVQHRAKPDAKPEVSSKNGYLPQPWVISQVEAAGFKLAGKSELNANPKDTTDHEKGVWTLPPALRLGDKDKDKYLAIGESDRMTLKFVKVAKKADPKKADPKKK